VRRRATLVSNRLNMPVRSLSPFPPSSPGMTSVTLTWALVLAPRLSSLAVIVAKSSQGGEEEVAAGFPFDRAADRIVCSNGERSKRFSDIGAGVDGAGAGCDISSGCTDLERVVGNVGGGGGGGSGEREDLEGGGLEGGEWAAGGGRSELTDAREDRMCRGIGTALIFEVTMAAAMWKKSCKWVVLLGGEKGGLSGCERRGWRRVRRKGS
jgi:hypothetical protein